MSSGAAWVPVARWELRRMLKRSDFLVSALITPLIGLGVVLGIGWFKAREAKKVQTVAVVSLDSSGRVTAETLDSLATFAWATPTEGTLDELRRAVDERRYDGVLVLPGSYAKADTARLIVRRPASWRAKLEKHLHERARFGRAEALGVDRAGLRAVDDSVRLGQETTRPVPKSSRADRLAAVVLLMLLIAALFTTVSYMSIGISGEKQARFTEVVLSAIPAQAWIDGKIVAYAAIGLAHAVLWVGSSAVMAMMFRVPLQVAVHPGTLAVTTLLFVLGMVVYIALYAMVLATIKDIQSTSKVQAYLYLLPMAPFIVFESVLRSPDSLWSIVISHVPFFSPFLLPMRASLGAVAAWEVPVAVVLLVVTGIGLRRAAGAAFRIGMLMYGKEMTLPELARWAKQS